jgi:hypothetical protein
LTIILVGLVPVILLSRTARLSFRENGRGSVGEFQQIAE